MDYKTYNTTSHQGRHFIYMNPVISTLAILFITTTLCSSQKRFISIDGTKVWINTIGTEEREENQPVVVFESGHGTPMDNWDSILEGTAKLAPILTYDRPGVGASEPDDEMPTVKNVADKLVKILDNLELPPPYLLVGHSLGGAYVRGFAVYYPEKLAGLVIIDPADFTETQENKRDYYDILGWDNSRINQELSEISQKWEQRDKNLPLSLREERQVLKDLRSSDFREITETPLPNIPVHMLTGGRFDMPQHLRSVDFDNEVLFRSKMEHRVARWTKVIQSVERGMLFYSGDAGHFVHIDDPELVVASIKIALNDYADHLP
jgi:pimeloyl-ACP methyl ester carboxylesterase